MTVSMWPGEVFSGAITAEPRRLSREELRAGFKAMSDAMVKEKGLLNHSQAGDFLEVSTKRIGELVRLGKLSRFDFMGRTYVSMKEVLERRDMDLKAGRPKRNFIQRMAVVAKVAAKSDLPQIKQGWYDGPYERHEKKLKQTRKKK